MNISKLRTLVKAHGPHAVLAVLALVGAISAANLVLLKAVDQGVEVTGDGNTIIVAGTGDDDFDMDEYCENADRVGRIEAPDAGGYTYILQRGLTQVTWAAGPLENNPIAILYYLEDREQKDRPVEMTVSARECAIRRSP